MKKKVIIISVFVLICMFGLNLNSAFATSKVNLKLNTGNVTLLKNEKYKLNVKVTGTSTKPKYSSSQKSIAVVSSNGTITAKKTGTATITVSVNGISQKCRVSVINLNAPVLTSWKKTYDSETDKFVFDGVTYSTSWKKIAKAKGYEIYFYELTEDRGWFLTKKATTKTTFSANFSHIDTKIKVKVRAYAVVNGHKIYSPWSKEKAKTIAGNNTVTPPTFSKPAPSASFKSLSGKGFLYKNKTNSFGIAFGKSNHKAYIGIWNASGTSSSYEDYLFTVREGQYNYLVRGMRSGKYHQIYISPQKNSVFVNIYNNTYYQLSCNNMFQYQPNAGFLKYANY